MEPIKIEVDDYDVTLTEFCIEEASIIDSVTEFSFEEEKIIKNEANPLHVVNCNVNTLPALQVNTVESLIKRPFSVRTFEEKVNVKQLGRPTPDLDLTQKASGGGKRCTYLRKFNRKVYENNWVCGCEVRNALFCFPCLLFGNNDAWSKRGVTDLGHLNEYIKKHAGNKKHLNNVLDLGALGTVNITTLLSRAYHDEKVKHNKQVEKNRYFLSRIIDCIKFCGAFELALRAYDINETSENSGVFLGLVDLISSIDSAVKEHMENSQVFKGTSKSIQNELLECMLETCREVIAEEIKEAEFVAVMADETTDVSERTQLVLVFRYEKNGAPHERFWGFFNPKRPNADALTTCILDEINTMFKHTPQKIIAQTYDGAAVMSEVQAKIKVHYPNAHYIHCYAHQLNLTMERAASQNQSARVFFLDLSGFPAFFSRSPERQSALESVVVARRIPYSPTTRWNFKSQTVNMVYEYKDCLFECLRNLEQAQSDSTSHQATGLRRSLEDDEFLFWLSFFHKVMPHIDVMSSQLQARSLDTVKVKSCVSQFIHVINKIRDLETTFISAILNKRRKLACRHDDAKEVCDRIIQEAHDRFEALDHLEVAKLLDSSKFKEYSIHFPEKELGVATQAYSMLDKQKLKAELTVVYERPDFRNIEGAVPLLQFIITSNLQQSFCEITKLSKILITIPMTSTEPERCFSSLKRIKTFLRNTVSEQWLSALAMLSIEKSLIANLEGFNSRVIDKFCSRRQQHMDFIFWR